MPSLVQTCHLEQAAEEHFVGGKVGTGLEDRLASVLGAWASWDVLPGEAHTAFCWDLDRGGDVAVGGVGDGYLAEGCKADDCGDTDTIGGTLEERYQKVLFSDFVQPGGAISLVWACTEQSRQLLNS